MESVKDFVIWLARWRKGAFLLNCVAPFLLVAISVVSNAYRGVDYRLEVVSVLTGLAGYPWAVLGPALFVIKAVQYAYAASLGLLKRVGLLCAASAGAVLAFVLTAERVLEHAGLGAVVVVGLFLSVPILVVGVAALISSFVSSESDAVQKVAEHLQTGKLKEALAYADLSARRGPKERENLRSVLGQLVRGEHLAEAIAIANVMVAAEPNDAESWRAKADLSYYSGDVQESMKAFDHALRLAPRNAEIHYDRGVKLARDPKTHAQALKDYTRAIELSAGDARFWANRASLQAQMGRHESALADATRALAIDPHDAVATRAGLLSATALGREDERKKWEKRLDSSGPAEAQNVTPEGREHRTHFPLLCQMGNDGNSLLAGGLPGRAQREYLRVFYYLMGKGMIDQYLLGKAYLGLLMVEALKPKSESALFALLDGPPTGGFGGLMAPVGHLHKPCLLVFERRMLAPADQTLFEALRAFRLGKGPCPQPAMEPWDLSRAVAESFPVLHLPSSTVAVVLDPSAPPRLSPEQHGQELHIEVPGL